MKVLMISSDRKIFDSNSAVSARMVEYGGLVEELHVVVFSKQKSQINSKIKISENTFAYPTNSLSRWFYVFDAIRIGKKITKSYKLEANSWLVTSQDPFESGLAAYKIAKQAKAKLQLQVHTDFLNPYFKKESFLNRIRVHIAKMIIPKADCIRVVSQKIKCGMLEEFPVLRKKHAISILPIFAEIKNGEHSQRDIKQSYPQFDTLLLSVARLEPEKNITLALDCLKEVLKTHPNTGLIIVGDGSEREALKLLTTQYSLQTNIVFAGWQDDVLSYYRPADIFLSTSNYEGYGMALVEAAQAQCAIVSTDAGIAENLLRADERRFLCPVGDAACLAEQVKFLIENPQIRSESGKNIKGRIKDVTAPSQEEYLEAIKNSWYECANKG